MGCEQHVLVWSIESCRKRQVARRIFPGQDDTLGERDVALIEGSFGARKSAAELGKLLHQHLNPQLTDEGLRHLVEYLRTGSRPF